MMKIIKSSTRFTGCSTMFRGRKKVLSDLTDPKNTHVVVRSD